MNWSIFLQCVIGASIGMVLLGLWVWYLRLSLGKLLREASAGFQDDLIDESIAQRDKVKKLEADLKRRTTISAEQNYKLGMWQTTGGILISTIERMNKNAPGGRWDTQPRDFQIAMDCLKEMKKLLPDGHNRITA